MQLKDKIILVTGASRGIGKGIATRCAQEGAHVAFTYVSSDEKARELTIELEAYGIKAKGYKSNAANYTEAEQLINNIIADFGDLHVVINNAGITKDGLLVRMTEENWDMVLDTNLKSVFNITKHATRHLMKNRAGSIINLTSIVGRQGNAGQANYAASKAGMIGFTMSVAKELGARNIRCNAIAPGFIATEMTETLNEKITEEWNKVIPLQRAGSVNDVANLCVFLASDASAYITGQTINVCGGLNMS